MKRFYWSGYWEACKNSALDLDVVVQQRGYLGIYVGKWRTILHKMASCEGSTGAWFYSNGNE